MQGAPAARCIMLRLPLCLLQIRAQLAAVGAPILGDTMYGADQLDGDGKPGQVCPLLVLAGTAWQCTI